MKELLTYRKIKEALVLAGIDGAAHEARLLISHFYPELGAPEIAMMRDEPLCAEGLSLAVEKRCERYPLQYIIGHWEFCNEKYRVSPDCLIPRAETELLVSLAVKLLPVGARFCDLCTGSGCIAVSTLAARRDASAVAVDLFDATLKIAAENARDNGVQGRVEFKKCDVLLPDASKIISGGEKFDAILSNPPYIKSEDIATLEPELSAEPIAALDGGEDGLIFYRAIIKNFSSSLKEDGFMLFEAGADTARGVAEIGEAAGFCAEVIPDLSGLDRMILLTRPK